MRLLCLGLIGQFIRKKYIANLVCPERLTIQTKTLDIECETMNVSASTAVNLNTPNTVISGNVSTGTGGAVGRKIEKEADVSEKKKQIKNALREIANGKEEVTLLKLRNDLEQYGGTNDVTLIRGNKKEGILHIIENGREHYLGDILDTVVEGKIIRRVEGNNSIVLQKDNVQAILALERFRQKKTWLLTGWDITTDPKKEKQEYLKKKGLASDEWGKIGAIHPPTQTEPIRSRHCLGADEDLEEIINQLKKKSRNKSMAQDMNIIKKEIREEMRATELAVREVMPLAGEFDSLAFDSAGQVYLKACRVLGVQATVQSARDVYRAVFAEKSGMIFGKCTAMGSKPISGFQSRFDR